MAFFIVVHHRNDKSKPWPNTWLNDDHLETIQTTKAIGERCAEAAKRNLPVFVHRCACGGSKATICAEVRVASADMIDKYTAFVKFKSHVTMSGEPKLNPVEGTNSYDI